jgi:hypothetical protein
MDVKLELSKMQLMKYDVNTKLTDLNLDFIDYAYLQFLVFKHCGVSKLINFKTMAIKDLDFLFSIEVESNAPTNLVPH